MSKKIPLGISIISFFILISAIFSIIAGLFIITRTGNLPNSVFLGLGVLLLVIGIVRFFIYSGLRKGKNWARFLIIGVESLSIISSLISLIMGEWVVILSMTISIVIVSYLVFSKKVRRYFR